MPELPEVETVCRGLDPVMRGQEILRAEIRRKDLRQPFPRGLKTALEGAVIQNITRRAKYILIALDTGKILVIHLGMSGRVQIESAGYVPKTHDHFILHLQNKSIIVLNDARRFGLVLLVDAAALGEHPAFAALGPEPLSNDFNGPYLGEKLRGKKVAVKIALMDPRIVVGVGNIYASEALFLAGISPLRVAGTISGARAEKLAHAIVTVLTKAIAQGGSTLRDHRQANGELGYFQHHFGVYDKAGKACPDCRCDIVKTGGVRRIVQGGRSSFYCAEKQK
jgi:formamidopyrimidine-DNA glycosylase